VKDKKQEDKKDKKDDGKDKKDEKKGEGQVSGSVNFEGRH